jgi:uncharacterized membrane protein
MRVTVRRKSILPALGLALILGAALPVAGSGQGREPVVHAVLFYSPTCPHCHDLINNHLIPLQERYGRQFVILAFDVTQGWASEIYWGMLRHYEIPQEDWVVPIVLVRDEVLIGGDQVPQRLTQIIEEGLAGDGVDLPNLPPLLTFLEGEGMLDPRYPDRRIVVQEPAPDEAAPEEGTRPPDAPPPAGDSGPGRDTLPPASDTPAAAQEPPAPDTQVAEIPVGVAQPSVPGTGTPADSLGAGRRDPVEAGAPADSLSSGGRDAFEVGSPADSLRSGGRDTVEAGEPAPSRPADSAVETEVSNAEAPPPGDTGAAEGALVPEGAAPGGDTVNSPSGGGEPAPPAASGAARPMDLAGAMQEMESMTMMDRFNQDRAGNSLSVLVLLGMLVSLALKGWPPRTRGGAWPDWVVPALVLVGVGVAAYLSFIEVTESKAVCGPVGDCNTVNQSEYATLFGFLPVGVLGLLGYASILVLWALGRFGQGELRALADLALWGAALAGTLFSVYLTFLEPFVIGATCIWCLTSAVIMTLILWATSPLAARAWPGGSDREG